MQKESYKLPGDMQLRQAKHGVKSSQVKARQAWGQTGPLNVPEHKSSTTKEASQRQILNLTAEENSEKVCSHDEPAPELL